VGLENISEALCVAERIPQCAGFDINSRVEVSPGLKDVAKVRKFQERMMV
jgi:phosphoribosylanthranilate isomerase